MDHPDIGNSLNSWIQNKTQISSERIFDIGYFLDKTKNMEKNWVITMNFNTPLHGMFPTQVSTHRYNMERLQQCFHGYPKTMSAIESHLSDSLHVKHCFVTQLNFYPQHMFLSNK